MTLDLENLNSKENISLTPLESSRIPAITEQKDLGLQSIYHRIELNKGLDESFFRKKGLELPPSIIGKTDEQLEIS